jgi:hypothetical protein
MEEDADRMRTTTYCYPWDLARLGVEETLDQIVHEGFDAIDLAATYHPIDALSPRGDGPVLFSDARGAVYFPALGDRYGRIKPKLGSSEIAAAWPRAAEHAARAGIALNSWTITLFQPWIADRHPETARVLPGGGASGSGVCAANDDVRDYVSALCSDISDQFGVALFRLEAVLAYSYDFDWMRPRVMTSLPPLSRALSSLCFCNACQARGRAQGLDVDRVRATATAAISAGIADGVDNPERTASLAADAEVTTFAEVHVRASIELMQRIDEAVGGRAVLATTVGTPYRVLLGEERDDMLMRDFILASGQVDLSPVDWEENQRMAALNAALDKPRELSTLCIVMRRPTELAASTSQIGMARTGRTIEGLQPEADLGVSEFTLYNYGLITDTEVRIFNEAVAKIRAN